MEDEKILDEELRKGNSKLENQNEKINKLHEDFEVCLYATYIHMYV